MDLQIVFLVVLMLSFSAFFSGYEIAFVSADKLHIELQGSQGKFSDRILSNFLKKPSRFIATLLVGNTIALVLYGILMTQLLDPWLRTTLPVYANNELILLLVNTIISTLIVLATAEFLPKSIFMINPNRLMEILAIPAVIFYYVLSPLVFVIVGMSKFSIRNILRLEYEEDKPVFGLTDLNNYISEMSKSDDENSDVDPIIFNNALEFKTLKVRDCMIPRTEIKAIDIEDGVDDLKEVFIKSGHSKILIYKDSIDNILGYTHSSALYKKPKEMDDIITAINIVPETMLANDLMVQFINENKSIALVVDEFGGTSGIVTIEDVMEEIFGDIKDEHDTEEMIEKVIDDKNYLFSARLEVDHINEKYNLKMPEGDYDTLGGLILNVNEDIPSINDVILINNYKITVLTMDKTRIDTVRVTTLNED
ncbi:MAG: hemolysin family protein [Cytophagales bacterium]